MNMKSRMTDGTLNRSISRKRKGRGKETSKSADESISLLELSVIYMVNSKKTVECKR